MSTPSCVRSIWRRAGLMSTGPVSTSFRRANTHMLSVSLLAAFPDLVGACADYGVTGRARERGLWRWRGFGLHDFANDMPASRSTPPCRRRPGMVLMPAPLTARWRRPCEWHGAAPTVVFEPGRRAA